ncbi:MAG TPA: MurT ligase domain-containing protein [Candidatus Saccharimonadales bacterium]|nr:MurT ligase domain-containing protein [Candidatus Saccharimonadales bacterium]
MQTLLGTLIAKSVQLALKLGRSKGQALPGLIVEKLFPSYLAQMAGQLPEGIVFITGTNGKTTTTKMVVDLLRAAGKRIITNRTGSNLTRGLVASFADYASLSGKLPYDLAVFEVDEAFAVQLVKVIRPRWVLALNVSRDQLDRFGEVDAVASLLDKVMQAATDGVITNANDPRLSERAAKLEVPVYYFGVAPSLRKFFPTDNELVAVNAKPAEIPALQTSKLDVELLDFAGDEATYKIDKKELKTTLQLTGQHNFQNAAAALALIRQLIPDRSDKQLVEDLSKVTLAFGRGEIYKLPTGDVQLVLVKNPPSFRQALASYPTVGPQTMIVINDNYADSRDVSWLWDVDFETLESGDIRLTSGSRAADMALRLRFAGIGVEQIEPDINKALQTFTHSTGDKTIFATYTAMLALHDRLSREANHG